MDICTWTLYDDDTRKILGVTLFIAGVCSVVLNGWLLVAFLNSPLLNERSMITLLNFCGACFARSLVAGFVFSGPSALYNRWLFGDVNCAIFGFLNQFIGIYQIEALTHMSIERYVVAKYHKQGWVVPGSYYALFMGLCWLFSVLYSVPVALGLGGYDLDYTCTTCGFNLVLPENIYRRVFTVLLVLLVTLKPVTVMLAMLRWTQQIEVVCYKQDEHGNRREITKSVKLLTCIMFACWTPTAMAGVYVVVSQLVLDTLIQPPLTVVFLASFGSEILPAVAVTVVWWTNEAVRKAMLFTFESSHRSKVE